MLHGISVEEQVIRLKRILHPLVQLSDADWNLVFPLVQILHLKKGDYFIREGQVCHQVGFLCEGILRVYYNAEDKEFTSYFNFHIRNPLVSAFDSFLRQQPSNESIHALEDSTIITITRTQLEHLYEQSSSIQKLGRLMAEQNYLLAVERIRSLQFHSASDRYAQLLRA